MDFDAADKSYVAHADKGTNLFLDSRCFVILPWAILGYMAQHNGGYGCSKKYERHILCWFEFQDFSKFLLQNLILVII